jgi:hypothetical protein
MPAICGGLRRGWIAVLAEDDDLAVARRVVVRVSVLFGVVDPPADLRRSAV